MKTDQIVDKVKMAGLVPMPVYHHTLAMAVDVLDRAVPGDMVECGVFAGAQVAIMATAVMNHENGEGRKVHLYDSFEGIPEAGPHDTEQPGVGPLPGGGEGKLVSSGVSVCPAEAVKSHMARWDVDAGRLEYHVGWFQDTVEGWPEDHGIALLRLDGDLYDSTLVCLEALYPHLSEGGALIIDDFTLTGCHQAVLDFFGGGLPEFHEVPAGDGCYWTLRS